MWIDSGEPEEMNHYAINQNSARMGTKSATLKID
jgi:hypothetical protein